MNVLKKIAFIFLLIATFNSCSVYNFTGAAPIDAKTFQVNYFQNSAELIEPGIERTFTQSLQNLILNQTNLSLTNSGGELIYEGEITDYRISPMAATADQRAGQNRLTISVLLRYTNTKKEDDNLEKRYSFFFDYPGTEQLVGSQLDSAIQTIYDRITQDIFNDTLAKW